VATTPYVPALCPAVYSPAAAMAPPVAEYVTLTATLSPFALRPYTANCTVRPAKTEAAVGITMICFNGPRFLTTELPDRVVLVAESVVLVAERVVLAAVVGAVAVT